MGQCGSYYFPYLGLVQAALLVVQNVFSQLIDLRFALAIGRSIARDAAGRSDRVGVSVLEDVECQSWIGI